jgi:oligopeptide transport system permease protein
MSTSTATPMRSPAVIIAIIVLALIALAALIGPWLSPHEIDSIDFDAEWGSAPSLQGAHWFGTDSLGRDVFVRTMAGGRLSLLVALAATLVSVLIGVAYGATAGFYGGRTDQWMMRVVDVLYALPFMFIVILLTVAFGRNVLLMFAAIGAVNWLDMARIVRGQTLSLRHREFVLAAELYGMPRRQIVRRHIVPNLTATVIAYATLTVPHAVLIESFLSFLGLGVQEPATSWGVLINDGARDMEVTPWALAFPVAFLSATLLCLNVLGERLHQALDRR